MVLHKDSVKIGGFFHNPTNSSVEVMVLHKELKNFESQKKFYFKILLDMDDSFYEKIIFPVIIVFVDEKFVVYFDNEDGYHGEYHNIFFYNTVTTEIRRLKKEYFSKLYDKKRNFINDIR